MAGISDMVSSALAVIRTEIGENENTREDDFQEDTLYRRTVNAFKPAKTNGNKRPRGRPTSVVALKMFLLAKPSDQAPPPSAQKKLINSGLGFPKLSAQNGKCILKKSWTIQDLEKYIVSLYPGIPLDLVGFHLGKSLKTRKLQKVTFTSIAALRKELFKGKLYIIPRSEISLPPTPLTPSRNTLNQEFDQQSIESQDTDQMPSSRLSHRQNNLFQGQEIPVSERIPSARPSRVQDGLLQGDETPVADRGELPVITRPRRRLNQQETERTTCPDCHRTFEDSYCIHCQQDKDYEESLRIDKERDEEKKRSQERQERLDAIKQSRKSKLPAEPHDGIKLKFRCSSGRVFSRRFSPNDSIEILQNYVGSVASATEHFQIFIPGRAPVLSDSRQGILLDLDLSSTFIQVKWLTEVEFEAVKGSRPSQTVVQHVDEQATEMLAVQQSITQADVHVGDSRPKRRAAVECNLRMQSWASSLNVSAFSIDSFSDTELPSPQSSVNDEGQSRLTSDTYRNYVEVVTISDSDEESDDSVTEIFPSRDSCEADTLITLTRLSEQIKKNQVTRLNIHRPSIWECTTRRLKKADFDPENDLLVRFSDDFGRTEEGIDQGGPKREYLTLVVEHVMNSQLFEGPANARTLSWNKMAYTKDHYLVAGIVIALSIVHGGPAPHCFSPALVQALEVGPKNTNVSIDDMTDPDLKAQLEKILNAQDTASIKRAIAQASSFLDYAGIIHYNVYDHASAKDLVSRAVHAYLFDRTSQAFEQFKLGLQTLKVKENFSSLRELFVYKDVKFTQEIFENLFNYEVAEEGSNVRIEETAVIAFWRDFLEDVEEGRSRLTFEQILQFCTGAKQVPPLGFTPNPTISFWEERFPKGVTCTNNLVLPRTTNFDEFVKNIEFGILNTQAFLLQ